MYAPAVVDVLSFADAAALLGDFRRGQRDFQDLGSPLVVIDLDHGDRQGRCALVPPAGLPLVLVGVSRTGSEVVTTGPDILVTETSDAPAPWVSAPQGLDRELERIETAVSTNWHAATTLVQVLRSSEGSSVEAALVLESLAYATLQGGAEHRAWLELPRRPHADDDPSPTVVVERDDQVLSITLDRSARRNAYSARMRDDLVEALKLAAADASIARVEIHGKGSNFCSGGDLAEFGTVPDTATAHRIRLARSAGSWIHRIASRTAVFVHGACVGAGVELPAFAGRVVADPDTTFRLPEVAMGLIPGAGGTVSIPRRIGRHRTGWLALTNQQIDTTVALSWGLVDELTGRAL